MEFHLKTNKKCYMDLWENRYHWENERNLSGKIVWQSTQHNCENGSTITQKKVIIDLLKMEKCCRKLAYNSYTRRIGQFHRENDRQTFEKCVSHNVITKMGCQWPNRKQQSGVSTSKRWRSITRVFCENHTRRLGQFH